jgi:hypothetical protein
MLASTEKDGFLGRMTALHSREQVLRLSNSDKVAKCLTAKSDHFDFMQPRDPFVMTLNTSRDERRHKIEKLMNPGLLQYGTTHQRGYNHTVGYGNFAKFNSMLKDNKDAMLKR